MEIDRREFIVATAVVTEALRRLVTGVRVELG